MKNDCLSNFSTIYKVTNLINEKFYIGITSRKFIKRVYEHRELKTTDTSLLKRAIKKYGKENFKFEPLWYCQSFKDAMYEERRLIRILRPEYNLTLGGEGTLGRKLTQEQIKRRGESPSPLKGKKRPIWVIKKMSEALKGRKLNLTNEQREKRRQQAALMREKKKKLGRPYSEKCREWAKKLALSRIKPVVCTTNGLVFDSTKEAARYIGKPDKRYKAIWRVCDGERASYCGFKFEWESAS